MDLRSYKNILALPLANGRFVAFHAHNLDLAEITSGLWESLNSHSASPGHLSELEEWSKEVDESTGTAEPAGFINSLSINVAQVCNLKCGYCAAGGDGTYGSAVPKLDLSKIEKQLEWIARKIPAGETLSIHFLGGEPLLYPKVIRHIADYIRAFAADRRFRIQFSITTNGTLINSISAKLLADLNCGVTVSLDGPAEVNDKMRPAKGLQNSSTTMTVAGLQQLQKVRDRLAYLKINSVFGAHYTGVLATYNYLQSLNLEIDGYNFNYANNSSNEQVTRKYLTEMTEVAGQAFKSGGLTELARFTQFRSILGRLESKTRVESYCGAGKNLLQIDTKHELYPCNWFMGDTTESVGVDTSLNLEKWNKYSKSLVELNNCQSCWARHLCGGGCMAVHKDATGSKHSKDPLFCLRSRTLAAIAVRFYALTLLQENTEEGERNEKHQKNPA